jgi:hypothetical protein
LIGGHIVRQIPSPFPKDSPASTDMTKGLVWRSICIIIAAAGKRRTCQLPCSTIGDFGEQLIIAPCMSNGSGSIS